jgi:hypothetical protein
LSILLGVPVSAAGAGAPQGPAGILLGSPLGFTSNDVPSIRVKVAGFDPGEPPNWPAGLARPDFEQFVAQITPTGVPPVPVLAMSLGIDVLAVDEEKLTAADFPAEPEPQPGATSYPVLQVGDHGWYAIEFTVDSRWLGTNPDLAPDIVATKDEMDGSVFCYILPESSAKLLPAEEESVRVLPPAALGLAGSDELRAINLHMGLYWTDLGKYPDVFTSRPLPLEAAVYFTLDSDLLLPEQRDALKSAWSVEQIGSLVIYRSRWNGTHWLAPTIYRTAAALRIDAPAGAAIDGLALDTKGTPEEKDDELLYSLRGTTAFTVPAARQLMYVAVAEDVPAKKEPRPVVVKRRGGDGYGSLGRQVRGGQGIGDFCTADPWVLDDQQRTLFAAEPLLDDFLIARRLPSDVPCVAFVRDAAGWSLQAWIGQAAPEAPCFGSTFLTEPMSKGSPRPIVLLPGRGGWLLPPKLGLAISGFRCLDGDRPMMRACMAWPESAAAVGQGTVRWGRIANYAESTTDPNNVTWLGSEKLVYADGLLVHDRPLPEDGALPPRQGSAPSGGWPPGDPKSRKAFLMQWMLDVGGTTYLSPIAALRY